MLIGDSVQMRPVAGEMLLTSVTVPVNPLRFVTITVEGALTPAFIVTLDGLATTAKSCTVTETVAECDSEPLVPVAVTV
jgi:hypothetical protein